MSDRKRDYAQNKHDPTAIVYQTDSGFILLKREDFESDEEFQFWKQFSDTDYHQMELAGRSFSDHEILFGHIPEMPGLSTGTDSGPDPETVLWQKIVIHHGLRCLTAIQRRRLTMYVGGMRVCEISEQEGVSPASVSESISAAKRRLLKFVKRF